MLFIIPLSPGERTDLWELRQELLRCGGWPSECWPGHEGEDLGFRVEQFIPHGGPKDEKYSDSTHADSTKVNMPFYSLRSYTSSSISSSRSILFFLCLPPPIWDTQVISQKSESFFKHFLFRIILDCCRLLVISSLLMTASLSNHLFVLESVRSSSLQFSHVSHPEN